MIVDMRRLAKTYLRTWFAIDLVSSIPISLILWLSGTTLDDGLVSIKFLKLTKFTRLYRLLTLFKVIKVFKANKNIEIFFSYLQFSQDANQIIQSLIRMVFLLHVVGCTFAIVAQLSAQEYLMSWINSQGIDDESVETRYIAACYWAVVTISTVGYGDITPTNETEVLTTIILVFIGVSMYSYIISRLTSIFASVKHSKSEEHSRDKILKDFISKQRLEISVSSKILHFFQRSETNIIHMSKEYHIDQLLNILPTYLKAEVIYYLFKDAINSVKVF